MVDSDMFLSHYDSYYLICTTMPNDRARRLKYVILWYELVSMDLGGFRWILMFTRMSLRRHQVEFMSPQCRLGSCRLYDTPDAVILVT